MNTTLTQNALKHGFVLTRHITDRRDGCQLSYWLATDSGACCVQIDGETPLFFIKQTQLVTAEILLDDNRWQGVACKPLGLVNFSGQAMACVYCSTMMQLYQLRDLFKQQGIVCYEDDIRPEDRFLMERFIQGSIVYTGECSMVNNVEYVANARCKAGDYRPTLSVLSLDVECDLSGQLFSVASYSEHNQRVIMIGKPEPEAASYIHWVADEKQLLKALVVWLNQENPDVIIGWNVVNFDFSLLSKRFELHRIPFSIGRDGTQPSWRTNKNQTEQKFITIAGRVVLDGIDLMKTATYNFASFSLDSVAHEILGKGKKVDSVDNRVDEIIYNFHHNKQALAEYNLMDCQLVLEIFEKTQLIEFAILRSQLTGLPLDKIGGSVAAFVNLYLPKLHRAGYVAPNLGDGESELQSPGGYVMDSVPGLHQNVLVLDFKSLYPSIIRTFAIDPMGMVKGLQNPEQSIPGFDGAYFSRDEHFLPAIIDKLWQARDDAKRHNDKVLSQAIKIIMNSFYGILGSTGCRFFDPRLSGSITKRSHQLLLETKQWLEQQGLLVIYGDTDSIFVRVDEQANKAMCMQLGKDLMTRINHYWRDRLYEKYQLNSCLEIEFETHFSQFFMPTIRGLDVGTKKRYAGLVVNDDGSDYMIFKGLETVRTDWTELAKQFQQQLYFKIFHQQPVKQFVIDFVNDTKQGKYDDQLVYRKRLRQKLDKYVKNVPPHVKAARLADDKNAKQNKPLKYQNKGWISYVMTVNGPETIEYHQSAIDYDLYIERQIKAVADAILPCVDVNFDQLINDQLSLF